MAYQPKDMTWAFLFTGVCNFFGTVLFSQTDFLNFLVSSHSVANSVLTNISLSSCLGKSYKPEVSPEGLGCMSLAAWGLTGGVHRGPPGPLKESISPFLVSCGPFSPQSFSKRGWIWSQRRMPGDVVWASDGSLCK